jgi:serine/threonine-protein kinase
MTDPGTGAEGAADEGAAVAARPSSISPIGPDALERWRRASTIVDAALDLTGEARERVVRERCGDDAPLEAEVRRWLAAADAPAPLFDMPPTPPRALGDGALRPGRSADDGARVGPWRVVRFVGAGGMGEVYEAERDDGAFTRRVALKVVRAVPERALLVRRFHRERQILAALDHPGIARLLDGGVTDGGVPYYVMELVEGVAIDEYCDRHRLGVQARVALARQVCAAVEYAHRRLVVHRDLKPSNVLVTADGVVKLVDFGIARLLAPESGPPPSLDASGLTQGTARILTPAYASPEQFRGEATTVATDVYSLSAVLYRLLAGRPPLGDGRSWHEAERAVLEREPERLSVAVAEDPARAAAVAAARGVAPDQLRRQLRGDLDTIVLYGLRKDPARRYGSVEALDADLARYLAGRPVAARPDGWAYRAGKFVRRNRTGVAVVTAAAIGLVATTGTAVVQARRAALEADRAQEVSGFLLDLLALPYPFDSGATRQRSLRSLLDSGAARAHMLTQATRAVRADVHSALARGYVGIGDYRTAAVLAQRSLEFYLAELGADAPAIADARVELGEALRLAGDADAAYAQYDSALPIVRRKSGERGTVTALVLQARSRAARARGDLAGAERGAAEAIDILEDSAGIATMQLANAYQTLGHVRRERGRLAAAESSYRAALEVRERRGNNPVVVAISYSDLAGLALDRGELAAAESLYARAIAMKRAPLGDEHPEALDDVVGLAAVTLRRGRVAEAERALRAALARYQTTGSVPAWRLVPTLRGIGAAELARGDAAGAAATLRMALDSLARATPLPTPQRAALLRLLADAERARGRAGEARRLLAECAAIYRAAGGEGDARALECARAADGTPAATR